MTHHTGEKSITTRISRQALLLGISLVACHQGLVYAQDQKKADEEEKSEKLEEIVVTGSRIKGAAKSGAIAVSVLSKDEIDAFGADSAGDLFANLAQAGSINFNDSNDGPNDARGDVASVNLRELGGGNTLMMLNGRRLVAHPTAMDISSTPAAIVNANMLPIGGARRLEVLRDGASALYGADATAGVINTVLDDGYEGLTISGRFQDSEITDFKSMQFRINGGYDFNDGQTHVNFYANYYNRDGVYSNKGFPQTASVDLRGHIPEEWNSTSWRNQSTRSPFGEFAAGEINEDGVWEGRRIRIDGSSMTSSSGRFHIQPCEFSGTREELQTTDLGCMGLDDSSLNSTLRYDFNNFQTNDYEGAGFSYPLSGDDALGRQLTPDVERINGYATVSHQINDDLQFFGDVLYYNSSSRSQRAAQPLDFGLAYIVVPSTNYYNPFGDGSSPYHLTDSDGDAVDSDVLIRRWRPVEMGPRIFEIDMETYRFLAGLRGEWNGWDWESAITHSKAKATDTSHNRMSKTKMTELLARNTPDALNPFAGPYANPQSVLDEMRISVSNIASTTLSTFDFKTSKSDLFSLPAGPVGAAFGIEWRREGYVDNRDDRLDGTIVFGSGEGNALSDVVGVSPTNDSEGSRNVYSAYAEILAPLVSPSMEVPGIYSFDLQVAARVEAFSDIEEQVFKPKFAASYKPIKFVTLRGAFSQGFRAPNLQQLNRGSISRLNQSQNDFYRQDVTNDPDDTGETYRRSVRSANPDLKPEDTETFVWGAEINIPSDMIDLAFGFDAWHFKQKNVIDNFGVEAGLALDYLMITQGMRNPNVVRLAVTAEDIAAFDAWNAANPDDQRVAVGKVDYVIDPYVNLDERNVKGWDAYFRMTLRTENIGRFTFSAEYTKLNEWNQERDALAGVCEEGGLFEGNSDVCGDIDPDRLQLNGKPKDRASGSLTWRLGDLGVGTSFKHIGSFFDTSARLNDEYWTVESYTVYNAFIDYRFRNLGADSLRVRLGVNNLTNQAPPLADESRGYFSSYHSNRGRVFYLDLSAKF